MALFPPICVILKVNLQCCEACPSKVNKQLRKIKGVLDVKIDIEEGLVTVFGEADSSKLIKAIKKVGRKAEIYMQPEDQPTEPTCTCKEDTRSTKSKHTKARAKQDDDDDDSDNGTACADFGDDDEPLPPSFSYHGAPLGSNNNVASNASYLHYPHNNASYHYYPQGTRIPMPAYINAHARFRNDYNDCTPHPPPMGYGRPQQPPYQNSYYHHHHEQQQQAPPPPPPYSYYGEANGCTIS